MRYSAALLILGLAACSSQPATDNQAAPAPADNIVTGSTPQPGPSPVMNDDAGAQSSDASVITPQGWGPLRIGMAKADVFAAVGAPTRPGAPDFPNCEEYHPPKAPKGMWVMIENDKLTRIGLGEGSDIATARGIRVGDTAKAVRAAYGDAVKSSPHQYVAAPAEYLTLWTVGGNNGGGFVQAETARGIRFETDKDARVHFIYAGGPSIQYVESCA